MACAARVLSLSCVKIGEEDRVRCGLMVISVSVGLGDKIPVAWLGCSKRSFGPRSLGPANLLMKSFGRGRLGPTIQKIAVCTAAWTLCAGRKKENREKKKKIRRGKKGRKRNLGKFSTLNFFWGNKNK
jgi:hypothetical protein